MTREEDNAKPQALRQDPVVGMHRSTVDTTEEQRNAERLRVHAVALEAAADGIVITDPNGTIVWVNPAFTRLTGYALDEACGQNPRLLKSGHHNEAFYRRLWDTIVAGQVWHGETVNRRKDGTLYTEEQTIAPVTDTTGHITHFVAIKHDITVEKNVERARNRLAAILEATSDFVGMADRLGQALYLNHGGRRMIGLSGDVDVRGRVIYDVHPEPSRSLILKEAIPAAVRDGLWTGETEMFGPNGSIITVSQVLLAHKAPDGEVEFISTIARDISDQKRAAQEIRRRTEELQAFYDLSRAVRQARSAEEMYPIIVEQARSLLAAYHGCLALINPEHQVFTRAYTIGVPSEKTGSTFPAAGTRSGEVMQTGQSFVSEDFSVERVLVWMDPSQYRPLGPLAIVPLRSEHDIIGTLSLARLKTSDNKPFTQAEIRLLEGIAEIAGTAIRRARLHRSLQDAYVQMVLSLAHAMESRDSYTGEHARRMVALAEGIAWNLGCSEREVEEIRWGARLHDIGKIGVPDIVLHKPGALSEQEWIVMRQHPILGEEILSTVDHMRGVAKLVRHHQEKWDGTGYPDRLRGNSIPLGARILAVVDAYGAITEARPYKAARTHAEAVAEVKCCAGSQFDPEVVEAFCEVVETLSRVP